MGSVGGWAGALGDPPVVDSAVLTDAGTGLAHRLKAALGVLSDVAVELEPGCLTGGDAKHLYSLFVSFERLSLAGKALLAPRIDASGIWRQDGHRHASSLLASLEGVSAGEARGTLELGHRLDQLPDTEDALRKGRLSGPKAIEITRAGVLDPDHEAELLEGAADQPLHQVKERCQRARATSANHNPLAAVRRIRANRHFSSWTAAEGAFCYQGTDTADRGAQILASLGQVAAQLRRQAASGDGGTGEPERAIRADALYALVTQGVPGGDRTGTGSPAEVDPGSDIGPAAAEQGAPNRGPLSIVTRPPTCSVMVRVDLQALLRGHADPGEICEIDGQGPISVPMARGMANDSFLRFVFHRSGDIRAISHFGRTINQALRTALAHRDRRCVVPGCGVDWGLEIDHVVPFAEGGPTSLDNLALLCHHHHFLKTFEGWRLTKVDSDTVDGGTTLASPQWRFEPLPPFGEEPDLGIDTPNGRRAWHQRHGIGADGGGSGSVRDNPDPDQLFDPG